MKLSEIALRIGCRMVASQDVDIFRIAGIDDAGPGDLTFVSNRKYVSHIKSTKASAIILGEDIPPAGIPQNRQITARRRTLPGMQSFLSACHRCLAPDCSGSRIANPEGLPLLFLKIIRICILIDHKV